MYFFFTSPLLSILFYGMKSKSNMSTASGVRRIIDAMSKTTPPKLPGASYTHFHNDAELLAIGAVVGIALAALALLWTRNKE